MPPPPPALARRALLVGGASALAFAPRPSQAAPPQGLALVDLMPAFWAYAEAARGASPARRRALFEELVTGPHPALFHRSVAGETDLDRYLEVVQPLVPRMRVIGARMAAFVARGERTFRRRFPDFRLDETVYLMPTFMNFDGGTRLVHGVEVAIFGIDTIAYRRIGNGEPLVAHELFHLYHAHRFPIDGTFVGKLWREGLATYVSRVLAPGASEAEVLQSATLAGLPAGELSRLAAEALARLDGTTKEHGDLFFRYHGDAPAKGPFPARCGYLVGYRAAALLGRQASLHALARLDPGALRPRLGAALERLSARRL
jgi:hypothetical protein